MISLNEDKACAYSTRRPVHDSRSLRQIYGVDVRSLAHQRLARRMVAESVVLLKNKCLGLTDFAPISRPSCTEEESAAPLGHQQDDRGARFSLPAEEQHGRDARDVGPGQLLHRGRLRPSDLQESRVRRLSRGP